MSLERVGSRNPKRQRHFRISGAEHHDDGSVVFEMRADGKEHAGELQQYPPEDGIATKRLNDQDSVILPGVEIVVDGEVYDAYGYTVEEAGIVVSGVLFAAARTEYADGVEAQSAAS